jgi:chemotaxis protein histidine kinase CheA
MTAQSYRYRSPEQRSLAKDEHEAIEPPDFMKSVMVKGRGPDIDAIQKRADQALRALEDDYLAQADKDLRGIEAALSGLAANGEGRERGLRAVHRIAHDMRGQAGTFGYDLVTVIGSSLCSYLEEAEDLDTVRLQAVQIHVDSMRAVLKGRITGQGGKLGRELLTGMQALVAKTLGKA